jgi:hypothetical protein
MSLPTITVPYYEMIVPSSSKKIKFRPFLVKEEKLLLMAIESKTEKEMYGSIKQTINNCVQGGIDVDELPLFDLEYIYLKIRSKSIGEKTKANFYCTECKETNQHYVDFEAVVVDKSRSLPPKIEINDSMGIMMKYPNMDVSLKMAVEAPTTQEMFDFVISCINYVYDKDNIMKAEDYSKKELSDFVESLGNETFEKMVDFIDRMPNLNYKGGFKCKKCGHDNKIEITESADFFF